MSAKVCIECATSLHFLEQCVCLRQIHCSYADFMQNTCRLCRLGADCMQILCRLFLKSLRLADHADFCKVCTSAKIWHADYMQTLHTWSLVCKVCIKFPTRSSKLSKQLGIEHEATGCVQVMRQLHRRLHLHVGLEDAAAKRCLVVCPSTIQT